MRPAPQTCVAASSVSLPIDRSTQAVPSVGCPANGISCSGVKIRVAYSEPSTIHGEGNVDSENPNSRGECLALLRGELVGAVHDGELVAGERPVREHVDDVVVKSHGTHSPSG